MAAGAGSVMFTGSLDGSSASATVAVAGVTGHPVTPWVTGIAALPLGSVPTRPPYANLKGSAASMIVVKPPTWWTGGGNVIRFANSDAELTLPTPGGRTPPSSSHNPGVALTGPNMQFTEGYEAWITWNFGFDSTFPKLVANDGVNNAFALAGELHGGVNVNGAEVWPAGAPFGSPATALAFDIIGGVEYITMARGAPKYDRIWRMLFKRATTFQVTFRIFFSADPNLGFRQVYVNGQQQSFLNGSATFTGDNTLHAVPQSSANPSSLWGLSESLSAYQMLYFSKGVLAPSAAAPAIMYHGDMAIGNSLAQVT